MIPKIIHYCWFGRNPKPDIVIKCIDSWKKHCPDYEIIEWNEDNFDVNMIPYTKEAYKNKKWAFVSDYARLWVINNRGGVYLDTDVLLHSNLDPLLKYDAWFAQDDIRYINTGLGFGGVANNELLSKLLEQREKRDFDLTICNTIDTPVIRDYLKFKQSRESQCIENIYIVGMLEYPKYGEHFECNSWKSYENYTLSKSRVGKWWKLKCKLRNPSVINFLERNGETKISKMYVFLAYDLLDNGIVYFIKRFKNKLKCKK